MKRGNHWGWSRREFVGGMALAGLGAYMGIKPEISYAEPPPETTTLRIKKWSNSCHAPFYVVEPFLREEGFTDIQYIKCPSPKYPEMLKAGKLDIGPEFVVPGIYNAVKEDAPYTFLAGLHVGCYTLMGSDRVKTVRDLKGKTVWAGNLEYGGPHLFFSAIVSYVGLDPRKDINYVWVEKDEAMRLFREGKIDGLIAFPPVPYQLRKMGVGRVLVDTNVDRPWSQYFCCMITAQSDFVKNNPIATRRALRALLKAIDLVALDPEKAAFELVDMGLYDKADYAPIVESIKEIPYAKWRDYKPEDTVRFYALRLRDVGMSTASPDEFIAKHTDWSHLESLRQEMKIRW